MQVIEVYLPKEENCLMKKLSESINELQSHAVTN